MRCICLTSCVFLSVLMVVIYMSIVGKPEPAKKQKANKDWVVIPLPKQWSQLALLSVCLSVLFFKCVSYLRDVLQRIQFGGYLDILLKRLWLFFFPQRDSYTYRNSFLLSSNRHGRRQMHNSEFSLLGGFHREFNGYSPLSSSQSSVFATGSLQSQHNY